jgi:hypothetical protein
MSFEVGDTIVVLNGTLDPDFSFDIGGWRGRIHSVDADDTVSIEWDSITLNCMDFDNLFKCEIDGLDWTKMTLSQTEIQRNTTRDTKTDVERVAHRLAKKLARDPRVREAEAE